MDKVIDGVDISECEYANACDKKLKCVILQDDVCETKPYCEGYNCYYKQLKRLEQKNEKLKQVTNDSIIEQEKLVAKVNELQAENEHYRKEAYRLADGLNKTENLAFTYKQALQEIRDIAGLIANTNCNYVIEADNIIKKINEVIGAEE